MSGVAEFSSLITPIFLTSTKNAAGIHAVRFFIRGKPWVVAIDDEMLFYNGVDSAGAKMLCQLALNVLAVCYLVELCCFGTLII